MVILSQHQAKPLLQARQAKAETATISPDLNLTSVEVNIGESGVQFPTGETVGWNDLEEIADEERKCFLVEGDAVRPAQAFSSVTGWMRTLAATGGAPTMLVSGTPMHRMKGTEPMADTLTKIRALEPVGRVLDTATGLGYTAIEAAKTASRVDTIEIDDTALEVARMNPWSKTLFDNPRINQHIGDAFELVDQFPPGSFDRILHDPPTFHLAGQLYSGTFYQKLHGLLGRRGRLFHYVGDPNSQSGHRTTEGVIRRLREAGFSKVERRPEAFGLLALK